MTLPPLARTALLVDLDGTLIDIAPTPDSVSVPADLPATLRRLSERLGGALAVVSGRPVEAVDRLLDGAPPAIAGEHGAAIRHARGGAIERSDLPVPDADWLARAEALVAAWPGTLMERKARGFTLHFRRNPAAEAPFHAFVASLPLDQSGFQLLGGSMVWEVRPAGVDKGHAVAALMARPPFDGRVPVFVGDDVTDEDGMRQARAMGGIGLRVDAAFGTPAAVRRWVAEAAEAGTWPPLPRPTPRDRMP